MLDSEDRIISTVSSKWIQYSKRIFDGGKFKFLIKAEYPFVQIRPRTCNQLGHCHSSSIESVKKDENGFWNIDFSIVSPKTDLFRLEFILEYDKFQCGTKLQGHLRLLEFGDPCVSRHFECLNGGRCLSDIHSTEPKCSCKEGFHGNQCQIKNFCQVCCILITDYKS